MKHYTNQSLAFWIFSIALFIAAQGCKSGSDLNSSALVQKRKYTKGYHMNARLFANDKNHTAHAPAAEAPSLAPDPSGMDMRAASSAEHTNTKRMLAPKAAIQPIEAELQPTTAMGQASAETMISPLGLKAKAAPLMKLSALASMKSGNRSVYQANETTYNERRTPGLAIAGFICSLVGIFIAGIPLGLLGVIFGAVSIGKINNNPEAWGGRGFAILAIILGLIAIIGALIVISSAA